MRFWRKRDEGFEWKDYVRTTILVRRNERRQKVEDAKQAAIFGVKQAGRKGADAGAASAEAVGRAGKAAGAAIGRGGVAAGSALGRGGMAAGSAIGRGAMAAGTEAGRRAAIAGAAFGRGAAAAARAAGRGAAAGSGALGRASLAGLGKVNSATRPYLLRAGQSTFDVLEPALNALLRPAIALPLTVIAVVAGLGAAIRGAQFGLDGDVIFAASVAILAAILVLVPRALAGTLPGPLRSAGRALGSVRGRLPRVGGLSPGLAGAIVAVLAIGGVGAAWYAWQPDLSWMTAANVEKPKSDPTPTVEVKPIPELTGRASVLSGDVVKVGQTTVRLAGVEAPEGNQRCSGSAGDRTWRCGEAARDALTRLVRGQQLSCRLAGNDDSGLRLGTCHAGDKDIAQELVRAGQVFAVPGFFARYTGVESEARNARVGVWQGETVERPSEFRAKRWEEAKRNAPEGCPIKGRVASGSRTYVLPWFSNYDSVRIRERRGERWFCSEQEARAAGWRPMSL